MASKSQVMQIPAKSNLAATSNKSIKDSQPLASSSSYHSSVTSPSSSPTPPTTNQPPAIPQSATTTVPQPELQQQEQGMTIQSNANQSLLQSEPCRSDDLPAKRLKDQAEGKNFIFTFILLQSDIKYASTYLCIYMLSCKQYM